MNIIPCNIWSRMNHKEGDIYQNRSGKWTYSLAGRSGPEFVTKQLSARAFVDAYLIKNPKYKPLFAGKSWKQIFAMLQMRIPEEK